ncbi:MAG: stalk domain-containing protein, partial [Bacillota bacterium]
MKATMVIHGTTVSIEPYVVLEGGRLVVPVRPVCEMLGANVDWDHAERSIRVTRAGHVIQYVLGRSQATVSRVGEGFSSTEVVDLPVAPCIRDGYAFAPLDSITKGLAISAWVDTEAFSCTVRADPLRPRSSLRLRVSPPGGWLAIDSSPVGTLPPHPTNPQESLRTLGDLAPGPHLVRVELEGYEIWEETIDLKPSLNVLDVVLRQGNRGRLRVLTEPPGGQVWIDGEAVGASPLSGCYLP